jgi:arginase
MRDVELILVPWDSGHREMRMGRGPLALCGPISAALEAAGHTVSVHRVDSQSRFATEAAVAFELAREIQKRVSASCERGHFPVVLAGNCGSSLGTVAALGGARTGVVWFDAHGDFNTPESTVSGFFDGMSLATLVGRGWTGATRGIPGWEPVREGHVVLVGARDLDDAERHLLEESSIARAIVDPRDSHATVHAIRAALDTMRATVTGVYVHLDLDVLDPSVGRANQYSAPGGMTLPALLQAIATIREHVDVRAAALTAYDPDFDVNGAVARAARELAVMVAT